MKLKQKITYFEIFLIVTTIISFAWIVGNYNIENQDRDIIGNIITEIIKIIDIIPNVSAQAFSEGNMPGGNTGCCLTTKDGASCIDLPLDADDICENDLQPTVCSNIEQCQLICSYDKVEGTCTPNTPKVVCENNDDCETLDNPLCIGENECIKGCCIFGLNADWTTSQKCKRILETLGQPTEFDSSIKNELECIAKAKSQEVGACLLEQNEDGKYNCKFTNWADCESIQGGFHAGLLCTASELNTICEKTDKTSCIPGKDEVYLLDSCNNPANIYDKTKINRQDYWTRVFDKDESCRQGQNNADSETCGNCDYNLGSKCAPFKTGSDKGNMNSYTCRDMNCIDQEGNERIHGESWCVFDGPVGGLTERGKSFSDLLNRNKEDIEFENFEMPEFTSSQLSNIIGRSNTGLGGKIDILSLDLVGSRHFRYICNEGKVEVEPCLDERREICVETEKELSNGRRIDSALCRANLWEQCIGANQDMIGQQMGIGCGPTCLQKCIANPDCRIQPVAVSEGFRFATCVPKYPPGFDETSGLDSIFSSYAGDMLGNLGGIGEMAGGMIGSEGTSASDVCNLGSKTCTSVWQKKCLPAPHWECIKNCECHSPSFSVQMTNLCVSLGDCGYYPNIEGKFGFGGTFIIKKGNKGRTPIQPILLSPIYLAAKFLPKGPAPNTPEFEETEDILDLPTGVLDPFLAGFSQFTGRGFDAIGKLPQGISNLELTGIGAGTLAVTQIPFAIAEGSGFLLESGEAIFGGVFGNNPIFGFEPIALIIAAAVIVAIKMMGCGEVKTVDISYTCGSWQPPPGGADCKKCDDDSMKPCSKYRCESLGKRCHLINENTGADECVAVEGEGGIPIITPWEEALNQTMFSYQDVSTNGFRVRTKDNQCIEVNTLLSFGIKTDVHAFCAWSFEPNQDISQMYPFRERDIFTYNHSLITMLPSVESLLADEVTNAEELGELLDTIIEEEGISVEEYILNKIGDLNYYVKCMNIDSLVNDVDYKINFCVEPGPDETSPVVFATTPSENFITSFDATKQDAIFWINEPAECKWSSIKPAGIDVKAMYDAMENSMDCVTDPEQIGFFGYACNTSFPITTEENKFYILCKDQPWLGEGSEENERNIGAYQGSYYEYILKKSISQLEIKNIKPSGIVARGSEPATIELTLETSKGAYEGRASCAYSFDDEQYILFLETNDVKHRQIFTSLTKGDYSIKIRCADDAGNIAISQAEFVLELDTTAPIVTRVFYSNALMLLTNENARCFYKNDSTSLCSFNFINSTEMAGGGTKTHTVYWNKDETYFIKCKDIWANQPDSCSIVVKPYNS